MTLPVLRSSPCYGNHEISKIVGFPMRRPPPQPTMTPDFFGLKKDGELQYRGRLDDAGRGDPANRTRELVNTMRQIAATGQGPRVQKPSMGCSIKWT